MPRYALPLLGTGRRTPSKTGHELAVVVVGAGQAGLAASYWLTERGIEHMVLGRGDVEIVARAVRLSLLGTMCSSGGQDCRLLVFLTADAEDKRGSNRWDSHSDGVEIAAEAL